MVESSTNTLKNKINHVLGWRYVSNKEIDITWIHQYIFDLEEVSRIKGTVECEDEFSQRRNGMDPLHTIAAQTCTSPPLLSPQPPIIMLLLGILIRYIAKSSTFRQMLSDLFNVYSFSF